MREIHNKETINYAAQGYSGVESEYTEQKGECSMKYNEYPYQVIKKLIERGQEKAKGNESDENSACLENISEHENRFMKLGISFPDFEIGEKKEYYRLGITSVEDGRYIPSYDYLSRRLEYGVAVLTSTWMVGLSKSFYGITDNMLASRGIYKIKGWALPVRGKCGELLIIPMDWAVKTDIETVEELNKAIREEEEKNGTLEEKNTIFKEEPVYYYVNEGYREYIQGIEMYNFKRPDFMNKCGDWIELMNRKKIYIEDFEARDWVTFVDELTEEVYSSVKIPHCCYSNGMTVVPLSMCIISRIFNIWDVKCIMKDGTDYWMSEFYKEFGAYGDAESFLENVEKLIEDREPGIDIYGNKLEQKMPPA